MRACRRTLHACNHAQNHARAQKQSGKQLYYTGTYNMHVLYCQCVAQRNIVHFCARVRIVDCRYCKCMQKCRHGTVVVEKCKTTSLSLSSSASHTKFLFRRTKRKNANYKTVSYRADAVRRQWSPEPYKLICTAIHSIYPSGSKCPKR